MKESAPNQIPEIPLIAVDAEARFEAATSPETASVFLVELLLRFTNELGERFLIGWFGTRGIKSIYYLAYAFQYGLPRSQMEYVANAVLAVIAISIAVRGISVTPLMNWYSRRHDRLQGPTRL